jgi:hypothetical protein
MKSRDQILLEECYKRVILLESFQDKVNNIRNLIENASSYEQAAQELIRLYPDLKPYYKPAGKSTFHFPEIVRQFTNGFRVMVLSLADEKIKKVTDEQCDNASYQIIKLGLREVADSNWFYFENPSNPKRTQKKKLHLMFSDPQHVVQFVALIKEENLNWISHIKFSGSYEFSRRRDNAVAYLTDEGLEHQDEAIAKAKQAGAIDVSLGEDFEKNGKKVSATEKEAARLALLLASKSNAPFDKDAMKRFGDNFFEFIFHDPYCISIMDQLTSKQKPTPTSNKPALDPNSRIIFKGESTNNTTSAGLTTTFGCDNLKNIIGDDVKFFSANQFTVTKERDGWFINHEKGAKNPTAINGIQINGKVKLRLNDVISVGTKSQKGKITVSQ